MDIQTGVIKGAASGLRSTADALGADVKAFLATVQAQVQAPGIDLLSPLIWAAHDTVLEVAMEVLSSNVQDWYAHAAKLDITAGTTGGTDQGNAVGLGSLQKMV